MIMFYNALYYTDQPLKCQYNWFQMNNADWYYHKYVNMHLQHHKKSSNITEIMHLLG